MGIVESDTLSIKGHINLDQYIICRILYGVGKY